MRTTTSVGLRHTRRFRAKPRGLRHLDETPLQQLPGWLPTALYTILLVAGTTSVPAIGKFGPLPTTTLLDFWIILFCITCFLRGRTEAWVPLLAILSYGLVTRLVPALYNSSPLEDFAQAYRWLLYLVAFSFAIGREWTHMRGLRYVTMALLWMALAKSALTFALLGPGERPGLLLENNFELALFAGLLAVSYNGLGKLRFWAFASLGALTLLSGSRSGAISFAVFAVWALTQVKVKNLLIHYLLACALPAMVIVPVWVFSARSSATAPIDRLNFLTIFENETSNWSWFNWLFGTTPITTLSSGACHALSSYDSLLASVGDGSCYAVILHAFALRVVFDAGVLGLLLAFGLTWLLLKRGGVRRSLSWCLLLIAASNSLSVSGLNNPYVSLPILLAICVAAQRVTASRKPDDGQVGPEFSRQASTDP